MSEFVEVSRSTQPREARTHVLVLIARGIPCRLSDDPDAWRIHVAAEDAERARAEIAAYVAENAPEPPGPEIGLRAAVPYLPAGAGAAAYAMVLFGVFGLQRRHSFGVDWTELGAANAGVMMDGALWRAATALTLHGDLGHLLGNLVFGALAGTLVAAQFGAGVGWLAIVLAGVLGNLLNAAFQPDPHAAVGASTAVFGALGFLAGAAQRARRPGWRVGLRRWAPVAAGAMLLAFLGFGGENTDIGAHVAGFAVGVALGAGVTLLPLAQLVRPKVQGLCAAAALLLLAVAWAAALAA